MDFLTALEKIAYPIISGGAGVLATLWRANKAFRDGITAQLTAMGTQLTAMGVKVDALDKKLDASEARSTALRSRLSTDEQGTTAFRKAIRLELDTLKDNLQEQVSDLLGSYNEASRANQLTDTQLRAKFENLEHICRDLKAEIEKVDHARRDLERGQQVTWNETNRTLGTILGQLQELLRNN